MNSDGTNERVVSAGGSRRPPRRPADQQLTPAQIELMKTRWQSAAAAQPRLDALMEEIRSGTATHGAQLQGKQYSLKGMDRLQSKLVDKVRRGDDFVEELDNVKDMNRYTLTFDNDSYVSGTRAAEAALRAKGYERTKAANSWDDPIYKGYNTGWRHPETQDVLELQFHTPESFEAKQKTHELYELMRGGALDKYGREDEHKAAVDVLQNRVYDGMPIPSGHEELGKKTKTRTVRSDVDPEAIQNVKREEARLKDTKNDAAPAKNDVVSGGQTSGTPGGSRAPPRGPGNQNGPKPSGPGRPGGRPRRGPQDDGGPRIPRGGPPKGPRGGPRLAPGNLSPVAAMAASAAASEFLPSSVMTAVADAPAALIDAVGEGPMMAAEMLTGAAGGGPQGANKPAAAAKPATAKPVAAGKPAGGESSRLAADSKVATSAVKAQTDAVKAQADAVKKSSDAMKSHVSGVQKFGAAQKAVTAGSKAWAVAQTLLNVVMSANPIGAIVVGIAAAVAAIVLLVKNWDKVKLAFDWVYKNVLLPVGNWFKNIWTETVVPAFKAATDMISGLFSALGDSIKGVWDGVMSGIKWVVGKIADALSMISNVGFGPVRTPDLSGLVDRLRSFSGGEKKADGGVIRGPGGPRGDAIAAWLSDGEYVINAASTARYKPLLDMINYGAPRFADGGIASWSSFTGDAAQKAARGLFGPDKDSAEEKTGTAAIWSRAQEKFGNAANQFAAGYTSDTLGVFGIQDTAPGFIQGLTQGSALLQAQKDSSVVDAAATDADALSSLGDSALTDPSAQIGAGSGSCSCSCNVDQSLTVNISTPDIDTAFQKAKTWESQRALSFVGRWS